LEEKGMVSRALIETIKLSNLRSYQIAQSADLHPSTLSRIICGIERVKPGDQRVVRLAKVLGLREEDCFDPQKS
jgi:hypothetical protein